MIFLFGFLGDVRGFYFPQVDYLFPSRFSDAPSLKIFGSSIFGELYEGLVGWSYMGAGLGFRYFGSRDGLFSDNSIYAGGRFRNFGISVIYGWVKIEDHFESTLGGMLSSSSRGKIFEISISAGYIYTPIISFEGAIKGDFATLFVGANARPGIYELLNLGIILDFGDITLGGIYRNAGNSFGVMVYYNSFWGPFTFSALSHADLGEIISLSSSFIFPR